eukprot:365488-Chlamydomonas_euryale.AAC.2
MDPIPDKEMPVTSILPCQAVQLRLCCWVVVVASEGSHRPRLTRRMISYKYQSQSQSYRKHIPEAESELQEAYSTWHLRQHLLRLQTGGGASLGRDCVLKGAAQSGAFRCRPSGPPTRRARSAAARKC